MLELNMNLEPNSIFTVTRALAVEAGLNTEQLDGIVQLGGYQYLKVTGPLRNKSKSAPGRAANIVLRASAISNHRSHRDDLPSQSKYRVGCFNVY